MAELAQRKTTKKPAPKRGKAKPKSSLAGLGWIAAAGLATGWVVSDGRAWSTLRAAFPQGESVVVAETPTRPALPPANQHATEAPILAAVPNRVERPPMPRLKAPERDEREIHVASTSPSPAPRHATVAAVPIPNRDIPQPAEAPASTSLASPPAFGLPAAQLPSGGGGERHATRKLPVHATPGGTARPIAIIDSGTTVRVMEANGRWRYVKSTASRAEGWVDGTFLAGEQGSDIVEAVQRPAAGTTTPRPERLAGGFAPPVPPAAIGPAR